LITYSLDDSEKHFDFVRRSLNSIQSENGEIDDSASVPTSNSAAESVPTTPGSAQFESEMLMGPSGYESGIESGKHVQINLYNFKHYINVI
jgi:hypothetical protein